MKKMVPSGLRNKVVILCALLFLIACEQKAPQIQHSEDSLPKETKAAAPSFNSDSAFVYVKKQVDFGPRVPASSAHTKCAAYLTNALQALTDTVIVQKANIKVFDGKAFQIQNIMGMINPKAKTRVLLCAHWDTRPWADQDVKAQDEPIDGANDGASGVGILIELARQLNLKRPEIGVDILFLDLEDYGQPSNSKYPQQEDTYALGTQYWSKNIPVPGYSAQYGILLDMVGAPQATFGMEEYSRLYAPSIVKKVWDTASQLGYSNYFIYKETGAITDDHYYINEIAKIPTIDIIHHDPMSRTGFGTYWHTHNDNINEVDRNTLKAVGQTLLQVIFNEKEVQ